MVFHCVYAHQHSIKIACTCHFCFLLTTSAGWGGPDLPASIEQMLRVRLQWPSPEPVWLTTWLEVEGSRFRKGATQGLHGSEDPSMISGLQIYIYIYIYMYICSLDLSSKPILLPGRTCPSSACGHSHFHYFCRSLDVQRQWGLNVARAFALPGCAACCCLRAERYLGCPTGADIPSVAQPHHDRSADGV